MEYSWLTRIHISCIAEITKPFPKEILFSGAIIYCLLDLEVNPLDEFGTSLTFYVRLEHLTKAGHLKKEKDISHYLNLAKLSLSEGRAKLSWEARNICIYPCQMRYVFFTILREEIIK